MTKKEFEALSKLLGERLLSQKLSLATAESCTGGMVSQIITMTSGSSEWFDRGFVTYTNDAKQQMLAVPDYVLGNFGAVSEESAVAMAKGALEYSNADVSLSVTGIAGPLGGSEAKPVGLAWFAWAFKTSDKNPDVFARKQHFWGEREAVREQATQYSLEELVKLLIKRV